MIIVSIWCFETRKRYLFSHAEPRLYDERGLEDYLYFDGVSDPSRARDEVH